jgi:hypothetical protein
MIDGDETKPFESPRHRLQSDNSQMAYMGLHGMLEKYTARSEGLGTPSC